MENVSTLGRCDVLSVNMGTSTKKSNGIGYSNWRSAAWTGCSSKTGVITIVRAGSPLKR
jgi:hypothetical protein